jgi:hypothetical protein
MGVLDLISDYWRFGREIWGFEVGKWAYINVLI